MTRTARNQGALRGHGIALALAGAAAAAVASVAGAASAATTVPHHAAAAEHGIVAAGTEGELTGTSAGTGLFGRASAAAAYAAAAHAVPARRPVQDVRTAHAPSTKPGASDQARPAVDKQAAVRAQHSHAQRARAHHAAVQKAAPASPHEIYDSVTPMQIPAHHQIATYADGGYAVAPRAVAGRGHVLWIDTNGSDPRAAALDVEPGDATPASAASWARAKLTASPNSPAIIYTMRSQWAASRAAIDTLPARMRSEVRWWIADPTGYPHIVPGASATQWYWGKNYDISSAKPGF